MAIKFLSLAGLQYFVSKVIGTANISGIGDGTLKGAVSALNSNLGKKVGCELALSSMHLSLVIDSMPTSSAWKAVPVSSDWGYGADSIVLGVSVNGFQTPVINNATYFEIANIGGVLSIIPRNSSLYGASYTLILARIN